MYSFYIVFVAAVQNIVYRNGFKRLFLLKPISHLLFRFARRCAENAFGITEARWRILLRTMPLLPKNVDFVVKAACALHNFLSILNEQSQQFLDHKDKFGNVVAG